MMKQPAPVPAFKIGSIPVFVDRVNGLISYTGAMTIDGDGGLHTYAPGNKGRDDLENAKDRAGHWVGLVVVNGLPYVRPDGFYTSTTAYQRRGKTVCDPARYLDAETIPFIAVPPQVIKSVPQTVLGSRVMVHNLHSGAACLAMVGDVGNSNNTCEGSEYLARQLGIDPDPRRGGTDAPIIGYEIHAGSPFIFNGEEFELQPYG